MKWGAWNAFFTIGWKKFVETEKGAAGQVERENRVDGFDVNTSLSSVPDTLHVQKLEHHDIGINLFRKNFHDVIV
jgi:hypothetical protein